MKKLKIAAAIIFFTPLAVTDKMPAFNSQMIIQEIADAQKKNNMKEITEAVAVHFLHVLFSMEAAKKMVNLAKSGGKPSIPFFKYYQTIINGSPDDMVAGMSGHVPLKQLVYKKQTLASDLDRSAHPWIYPQIFKKHGGMSLRTIFADGVCFDLLATMLGPHFYIKKTYGDTVQECDHFHVVEMELSLEIHFSPCIRNPKVAEIWSDAADVTVEYCPYQLMEVITLPNSFIDNMPPLIPA